MIELNFSNMMKEVLGGSGLSAAAVKNFSNSKLEEAHEKIKHFSDKFKVKVNKLENKETYYIEGFHH